MTNKASFFFIMCLVLACCICVAGCVSQDGTGGDVRILQPDTIWGDWTLEIPSDDYVYVLSVNRANTYSITGLITSKENSHNGETIVISGVMDKIAPNQYNLIRKNVCVYADNALISSYESDQVYDGAISYNPQIDKITYTLNNTYFSFKRASEDVRRILKPQVQPTVINQSSAGAGNSIVGDWVLERGFSDFSIYLIIEDDDFFGIKYLYGFELNSSDGTIMPGDSTYYYGNLTNIGDNRYNLTADYEEWRGKNNTLIYAGNNAMNMGTIEYDKASDKVAYIVDNECLMLKRLD